MSKIQSIIVNVIAGLLAVVLLVNFFMADRNQRLNLKNGELQNQFNNAKQANTIFQQIVMRIRLDADKDSLIRELASQLNPPPAK